MYHLDVSYGSKTMSHMIINHKCTFQKINNINPTRGNSIKNRAQSTVHFQIKGRERRSVPWLIDSWRDIGSGASEGETEGGADFKGREVGVEEEERI
jgi:hypothetical protein